MELQRGPACANPVATPRGLKVTALPLTDNIPRKRENTVQNLLNNSFLLEMLEVQVNSHSY